MFLARLLRHCGVTVSIRGFEVRPEDRHLTALKPSFLTFKAGLIFLLYKVSTKVSDKELLCLRPIVGIQ